MGTQNLDDLFGQSHLRGNEAPFLGEQKTIRLSQNQGLVGGVPLISLTVDPIVRTYLSSLGRLL